MKGISLDSKKTDDFARFENIRLIKSSDLPVGSLSAEQKALLNRKGNEFFNRGDLEAARRIFITTGYSDGLTRIGDSFAAKGNEIEALKLYWLAHNRRKADAIIIKLSELITTLIH